MNDLIFFIFQGRLISKRVTLRWFFHEGVRKEKYMISKQSHFKGNLFCVETATACKTSPKFSVIQAECRISGGILYNILGYVTFCLCTYSSFIIYLYRSKERKCIKMTQVSSLECQHQMNTRLRKVNYIYM